MSRRAATVAFWFLLVAVLSALTPLAYASPPDPTWVSGFFDDDDSDDAVFFITSSTATLDPFPTRSWNFFPVSWPEPAREDRSPAPAQYSSAVDVRAPPSS